MECPSSRSNLRPVDDGTGGAAAAVRLAGLIGAECRTAHRQVSAGVRIGNPTGGQAVATVGSAPRLSEYARPRSARTRGETTSRDRWRAVVSVSLTKGGNVSLTKEAPGLTNVVVGLGWDVRTTTGTDFDLDASAIVVGADGRVLSDKHFVFFNNLTTPDGTVEHTGDNLTGEGEGDDEIIKVNLSAMSLDVERVVFPVSIYDADARRQSFGQVANAYIRVVNADNDAELTRFDLTEAATTETAMVFGELYRRAGEWKFRAVGQGYASGLRGIALDYGVNV